MFSFFSDKLGKYENVNITLTIPAPHKLQDFRYLAIWCRQFTVSLILRFISPCTTGVKYEPRALYATCPWSTALRSICSCVILLICSITLTPIPYRLSTHALGDMLVHVLHCMGCFSIHYGIFAAAGLVFHNLLIRVHVLTSVKPLCLGNGDILLMRSSQWVLMEP